MASINPNSAKAILGMVNPDTGRITCPGTAGVNHTWFPEGERRCKSKLSKRKGVPAAVDRLLRAVDRARRRNDQAAVDDTLQSLAEHALCSHHAGFAHQIVARWQALLEDVPYAAGLPEDIVMMGDGTHERGLAGPALRYGLGDFAD
jgi:hypothetical protein